MPSTSKPCHLRLTGREDSQIALVEAYAKHCGFWADDLGQVEYERVLRFDLSAVTRTWPDPPTRACP